MKMYELYPVKDARKSFYHKAIVIEFENVKILQSYETNVLEMDADGMVAFGNLWDCSPTTLRHVKEALWQWTGFEGSKRDIIKKWNL